MIKDTIPVTRGSVIGIGKLKVFPSKAFPYEIPMLSFIVTKTAQGAYVSTCIQLHLDGYGEDPEIARNVMLDHCVDFLNENFTNPKAKAKCWDNLRELFTEPSTELWAAYRDVQINLAERGVSTDITSILIDRITELEKQLSDLRAMKEKAAIGDGRFEAKIVDYQRVA
jgi:hypothetical protein